MKGFTDIRTTSLIVAIPPGWRPYARLMRLDRPIGTWLLLLPCWWGLALSGASIPNLWFMLVFALGAVIMRGAGCTINDIYDRKLDAQVERTRGRPLASGEITLMRAFLFLFCLLSLGLGLLLCFNEPTIITGCLSLILIAVYPLMKRITWWPQLFLGFTFNWGVLLASTAVTGHVTLASFLAYVAGIFWTLAYDTIYAHQDTADDVQVGIKSTALLFGPCSRRWVASFYAGAFTLLLLSGWAAGLHTAYGCGLLIAAGYTIVQLALWRVDDPADCLLRFRHNRNIGLIIFVAMIAGKIL